MLLSPLPRPAVVHGLVRLHESGMRQALSALASHRRVGALLVCWGLAVCLVAVAAAPLREVPRGVVAPFTIGSVSVERNLLVVTIVNTSSAPLPAHMVVSVDGGAPHAVPAGLLPLPGAAAAMLLADEVVQRRAHVTIEVRTMDGRAVRTVSAVVAPDEPNDIELAGARIDADGSLIVVVQNHSSIPLLANVVISARDIARSYELLATTTVALDLVAQGSQEVGVGHVGPVDLLWTWIALTTDAINDADIGNDVYRP